jgi:hypothetical protein
MIALEEFRMIIIFLLLLLQVAIHYWLRIRFASVGVCREVVVVSVGARSTQKGLISAFL